MTESVGLRSTDGLSLEAALDAPAEPVAALVICHPHPKMGGTMNAPLLLRVRDELDGWAILRFNFRGIGGSEGESGIGIDEMQDAEGAIELMKERFPTLPLAIAGWSFGAAVAVKTAAAHPELAACVAIAPAVEEKPGITAGLPPAGSVELRVPTLFIIGVNDDLVEPAACLRWAEASGAEASEMKGANHFFWGKYDDLAERIASFLGRVIAKEES
jgi:alpha/beta superfamily hydrolase